MNDEPKILAPVLLSKEHDRTAFDCGSPQLNEYLKRYALQNQIKDASRTYAATVDNKIIGYYSLAYGSVSPAEVPKKISAGLGRYPIPVLLLARLAVDSAYQGKKIGAGLLRDALLKAPKAAEIAGLRAMLVHAKDDSAKQFYERFGFASSPVNPYHLFMVIDDIRASISH